MAQTNAPAVHSTELVYAAALLDLAQESGVRDSVADEVKQLGDLLQQSPDLARLLDSRALSVDDRASVLERIFKGRTSDLLYRFIQVVNAKGRLHVLPGILVGFKQLLDKRHGLIQVDAFVAQRLEPAHEAEVAQRLGAALGRTVVLHQNVDPTLIGGLKLRIGDEIVDGSVVAQLRILREKMIASGRQNATEAVRKEEAANLK